MANYLASKLAVASINVSGRFQDAEKRFRGNKIYQLFSKSGQAFFPNYESLKTSHDRPLKANYFLDTSGALDTTGRTHDHTGGQGDTADMVLTWQQIGKNFMTSLKMANNKGRSWQELFNDNVYNLIKSFVKETESIASTYLFTNRSGVISGDVKGEFNAASNVYEIDKDFKNECISIADVIVDYNAFGDFGYTIVCDGHMFTEFRKLAALGAQNATNWSFQFDGKLYILDTTLGAKAKALDAAYTAGVFYVIPNDTIAALDWNPTQNREGKETKENKYGIFVNPVDGMQIGVHSYEGRADTTALGGQKQDVVTQYQFTSDITLQHAPLSEANRTPIMLFAVKNV